MNDLFRLLQKHLVVFAQRGAKNDTSDALETVNSIFPFRLLPADIEHVYSARVHEKCPSARIVVKRMSMEMGRMRVDPR